MNFLLDENITSHFKFVYPDTEQYPKSIDVLGRGVKDEEILTYILKHNQGLITSDCEFSLTALWNNVPVIFHKRDGTRYYTKPKSKQLEKAFTWTEFITGYILIHDEVVRP